MRCTWRDLITKHNASGAKPELSPENIYVLEKGREVGGARAFRRNLGPARLAELVPDFEKTAPLDTPVTNDGVYFLSESRAWRLPITPPPLANHGNFIVSLNKIVKWLGGPVEQEGVNLFTQFAGKELIYEGHRHRRRDHRGQGVDKEGKPKDNYTPGYELRAKVTVLAGRAARIAHQGNGEPAKTGRAESAGLWHWDQGTVGSSAGANQARICGAHARLAARFLACTVGAGSMACPTIAFQLGMVIGLDYHDPRFDPHEAFQKYKTHPFLKRILEGGKLGAGRRRKQSPMAAGIPSPASMWTAD